jgi:parallel beta-helix repeat protein
MTVTDCEFSDGGKMFVSCCRSFVIDSCIFDERLLFMNCTEFEISNCTDVPQQQVGLHLDSCHRFNVTGNVIDGRAYDSVIGCSLMSCDNATLSRNILSNCSSGLWMSSCRDIRVFHNDFLENDKDASVTMTKTTHPNVSWDNGYPSGGNYWSNFSSLDAFGGPDQDTAGSDGIMDEPYVVPGEGVVIPERTDRYPLAAPYSS